MTYPYDRKLKTKIKEIFEAAGWRVTWESTEAKVDSWGSPSITFKHDTYPRFMVQASFSDQEEGATCKRRQIGSETRVVPIFEFACPEGTTVEIVDSEPKGPGELHFHPSEIVSDLELEA